MTEHGIIMKSDASLQRARPCQRCSFRYTAHGGAPLVAGLCVTLVGCLCDLAGETTDPFDPGVPGKINKIRIEFRSALRGHSIQYIPSNLKETSLWVKFTPTMPMSAGDIVVLKLPKFSGKSTTCVRIAPPGDT